MKQGTRFILLVEFDIDLDTVEKLNLFLNRRNALIARR